MTVALATAAARGRSVMSFDASRAFDAHGGALLGFAVNALGDRGLAEDCVQETFLRAWRARGRFDGERGGERTWLFAIARNVIADALRGRARVSGMSALEQVAEPAAEHPDPLDRLGMIEELAKLSDDHRAVIVAVHVQGCTYQELAARTGVPVATLRTRAFYALRALRAHLDAPEDPDEPTR
jgi:RNA polymerase sigma-70 factor (ECF subfamily)